MSSMKARRHALPKMHERRRPKLRDIEHAAIEADRDAIRRHSIEKRAIGMTSKAIVAVLAALLGGKR
jgi:hypothetical protein